jgi:hypothetical protein
LTTVSAAPSPERSRGQDEACGNAERAGTGGGEEGDLERQKGDAEDFGITPKQQVDGAAQAVR